MKSFDDTQKGFTLIELIVVIAILTVGLLIAIPKYLNVLMDARVSAHNANVRSIMSSSTLYRLKTGETPDNINALIPGYIEEIPQIPTGLSDYISDEDYSSGYTIEPEGTAIVIYPTIIE